MWHRVHIDLLPNPVDAKAAQIARLQSLGATFADVGQGDVPWTVMADPAGNEFCVLGRREWRSALGGVRVAEIREPVEGVGVR